MKSSLDTTLRGPSLEDSVTRHDPCARTRSRISSSLMRRMYRVGGWAPVLYFSFIKVGLIPEKAFIEIFYKLIVERWTIMNKVRRAPLLNAHRFIKGADNRNPQTSVSHYFLEMPHPPPHNGIVSGAGTTKSIETRSFFHHSIPYTILVHRSCFQKY